MQAARATAMAYQDPAAQLKVLVVDDDPIYRETARMFLSMYGRAVTLAENGKRGLEALRAGRFDIMVCDFEMPDLNGLEVIAEVARMPECAGMPIIMVTSRDDAMAIDRAFELGASSFVVKPVNWTLLNHYLRFVHRAAHNEALARRAQNEAEQTARTKDNLLSVLRHEMKTPLNAITGFTRLAEEAKAGKDIAAMHAHIDMVVDSGRRLLASLTNMSLYSDLISGRVNPDPEALDPDWLIDDALDKLAGQIRAGSLEIVRENRLASGRIVTDGRLMTIALAGIIENALLHARDATRIRVEISASGPGEVAILVADDGEGMEQAVLTACLEPFAQADMSLSRPNQGLGLGLPIARAIASLAGGTMGVTSTVGQGTTVVFRFPAA